MGSKQYYNLDFLLRLNPLVIYGIENLMAKISLPSHRAYIKRRKAIKVILLSYLKHFPVKPDGDGGCYYGCRWMCVREKKLFKPSVTLKASISTYALAKSLEKQLPSVAEKYRSLGNHKIDPSLLPELATSVQLWENNFTLALLGSARRHSWRKRCAK